MHIVEFSSRLLIFLLGCLTFSFADTTATPNATRGQISLTNSLLKKNSTIQLTGEWEFYWKKFLGYADFLDITPPEPDSYIILPSLWEGLVLGNDTLPREGFATYRLKVRLDTINGPLAFKIKRWSGPLKLYVDDKLVTSVGTVGETPQTTTYDSRPHVASFTPVNKEFYIILQVSNYKGTKRAGLYPLIFGPSELLVGQRTSTIAMNLLIFGGIFVIGICLILVYGSIKPRHRAILFLSISCILLSMRSLLMGESFFNDLFPHFLPALKFKLELSILYLFAIFISMYAWALFPDELEIWVIRIVQIFHLILIAIVCIFPYEIALHTLLPQHIANVLIFLFIFRSVGIALQRKHRGALIYLTSLAVFFVAIIHDSLVFHAILKTPYILSFGFLLFIIIQVFLVSYLYTTLFKKYSVANTMLNETSRQLYQAKTGTLIIEPARLSSFCKQFDITNREQEVVAMILEGATNSEIAAALFISIHTVRRHINNIYKKTSVLDRNQFIEKIGDFKNVISASPQQETKIPASEKS